MIHSYRFKSVPNMGGNRGESCHAYGTYPVVRLAVEQVECKRFLHKNSTKFAGTLMKRDRAYMIVASNVLCYTIMSVRPLNDSKSMMSIYANPYGFATDSTKI
jgi:hypothetical protein